MLTCDLLCAAVRDFSSFRSGLTDASPDFENCLQPKQPEGRLVDTRLGADGKPVYNPVTGARAPVKLVQGAGPSTEGRIDDRKSLCDAPVCYV